ncbi:MAG: DUF47 domain-containing protein [Candidatus Micrarchaeia archaeon]|jgi:uncharacterized protein Yka (UPF0111/DUF47 family)
MGFIERILEGGEEKLILKFGKIVDIGLEAVSALEKLIRKGGSIEGIRALEKESDEVAFGIAEDITNGAVAPNLIDTMLELVDKEDNIIDSTYNLAREFVRYNIKDKKLNKRVSSGLVEILDLARSALFIMKKMHKSRRIDEVSRYRKEIERLEEKGDEIKDKLFDEVYKRKMDFKTFYHIIELVHQADDILDNCEDSSDIFMTVMSSILS